MEWFVKAFIRASLAWFALGITLGLAMAAHPPWAVYRPVHAHMNVVGFITMMVFGVGLHEADIVGTECLGPCVAVAQYGSSPVDRHDFGFGIGESQRHYIMTDCGSDIEHAAWLPFRPGALDPVHDGLACTVGESADPAGGRGEDPAIVICTGREIVRAFLAMVAAGHAMDIDCILVARHADRGVEFER